MVKQLNVFSENRPGKLEKITGVLANANVTIMAMKISSEDENFLLGQMFLGDVLYDSGEDLRALEIFKACLENTDLPEEIEIEARYKMVQIYYRLGNYGRADTLAKELYVISPRYRNLADLQRQLDARIGLAS